MKRVAFASGTIALLLVAAAVVGDNPTAGNEAVLRADSRTAVPPSHATQDASAREHWLIPLPGQQLKMHATVLRPRGRGPFPLAVINHGSMQSSVERSAFALPEYRLASQWLLERGFVVALPLRPGHGATGGPYFEDQGRCDSADYRKAGLATAMSIQATVDHLTAQPFVRGAGVIVVGQSAGGWGALALASRNPEKVAGVINFAGGRGGHAGGEPNNNCVPERLVEAAAEFGRTARIRSLWLYAENDSYFAPSLSKRMYEAYGRAGGEAEYHLLPSNGEDGHKLIYARDAAVLWTPIVAKFLAEHRYRAR